MKNIFEQYLENKNLDIREKNPGYSRFMDQKVTPDVLSFISDCVLNFVGEKTKEFTVKDIWDSGYFRKNVIRLFGKPSPDDKKTTREYDKFVGQPLKTLLFSQILKVRIEKNTQFFMIDNKKLLQLIAQKPENAYLFIYHYTEKVLKDSGFYKHLEKYRDAYLSGRMDKEKFEELKANFISFMIGHTEIKKTLEPRRIFPKIINVFAAEQRIPGSVRGSLSKYPFLPSDLLYNRINFRDKKKNKGITRKEAGEVFLREKKYSSLPYRVGKAKNKIKQIHSASEVHDQWANGPATQVHHIFSEHEFPQLSDRLENLIRLTPTQHNTKAHPNNNTQLIDKEYQLICLLAKTDSVEESVKHGDFNYSRESLIGIINAGLKVNFPYTLSFDDLREKIKEIYRESMNS